MRKKNAAEVNDVYTSNSNKESKDLLVKQIFGRKIFQKL